MKLKSFYFLLSMVAIASIFTFCTKESQITPVESQEETNQSAVDRTKCLVTVTVNNGAVNVCGTGTMLTACSVLANGETLRGNENVAAPFSRNYGVQTDDAPTADGFLVFTNIALPPFGFTNVTVSTGTGVLNFSMGAAPVTVKIDTNCVPTIF